jgi:hypothetical protein
MNKSLPGPQAGRLAPATHPCHTETSFRSLISIASKEPKPMSEGVFSVRRPVWWAAAVGGVFVSAALFSPTVRAVGQSFLDAFRLPRVVAIGLDDQQMTALRERLNRVQSKFDLPALVAENVEVAEPTVRSARVNSAREAGQVAGMAVRTPAWLPEGVTMQDMRATSSGGGARFKVDVGFANQVLDFLELRDALLPASLDGQTIAFRLGGRVETSFARGDEHRFALVQARLPEVSLPEGTSLTPFGYAYLRMLGLDAEAAHRIAATTDWRSTFVLPIPARFHDLQQVIVRGQPGFLLTPHAVEEAPRRNRRWQPARATTLAWTEGDQVFVLSGNLTEQEALTIAGALQ